MKKKLQAQFYTYVDGRTCREKHIENRKYHGDIIYRRLNVSMLLIMKRLYCLLAMFLTSQCLEALDENTLQKGTLSAVKEKPSTDVTKSSATADGPRDALC